MAPDVYQPQSMRGLHDCSRRLAQSNALLVPNSIIICQVIGLVTAFAVFFAPHAEIWRLPPIPGDILLLKPDLCVSHVSIC